MEVARTGLRRPDSLSWIAIPSGRLGARYLIECIGLIPTLVAVACAYVVATLRMLLMPGLRLMDAPSPKINATSDTTLATPRTPHMPVVEGKE